MFSHGFHPLPFLRAVAGTEPFEAYCRLRGIPFNPAGTRGEEDALQRWATALGSLPADAQARIELELSQVHELSTAEASAHLLEASAGGAIPDDVVPVGAALALWFFVHRPALFQDVFFRHEVSEVHSWRTARTGGGLAVPNPAAAGRALGEELREFFRQNAGTGRFCAVDARVLPDAVCFAARVADRIQLVEGFADDGTPALQRLRPALSVLFAYDPREGMVRLKSPVRADEKVRDLFERFGRSVLRQPVAGIGEGFDLDRLKRSLPMLPDAPDMDPPRLRTLHLRYPARLGRRTLKLETRAGDAPDAMAQLLRAHVPDPSALAVCHAEIQVRCRAGERTRSYLIRLWPDRCNLGQTPHGERLRRCLTHWGLRYA